MIMWKQFHFIDIFNWCTVFKILFKNSVFRWLKSYAKSLVFYMQVNLTRLGKPYPVCETDDWFMRLYGKKYTMEARLWALQFYTDF